MAQQKNKTREKLLKYTDIKISGNTSIKHLQLEQSQHAVEERVTQKKIKKINDNQKILKNQKSLITLPQTDVQFDKQNKKLQKFSHKLSQPLPYPSKPKKTKKHLHPSTTTQKFHQVSSQNNKSSKLLKNFNHQQSYKKKEKCQINNNLNSLHPMLNQQKQNASLQVINLQNQNINQLYSFIRGAYDNQINEYSDVINLSMIDKFRKQFYIFGRLYDQVAQTNLANKFGLRDIKQPNLKDIVFLNQQKNYAASSQFLAILNKLRIIQ